MPEPVLDIVGDDKEATENHLALYPDTHWVLNHIY